MAILNLRDSVKKKSVSEQHCWAVVSEATARVALLQICVLVGLPQGNKSFDVLFPDCK